MNNSVTERFVFFCSYYFRKLFSQTTADDLFRKRFYRATGKETITILDDTKNELIFKINNNVNKGLRVCVRKKSSSDIQVFSQVFAKKEYETLVKTILETDKGADIRFIIDAGANIGFTSLYLQQFFPEAFFFIIEPDEKNMEQVKKNFGLNNVVNAELHLAGAWSSDCWLQINKDTDGGREWSYYVTVSDKPTDLKGISLSALLNKSDFPLIDILKIDIEGGEKELFKNKEHISPVLQKTRFLAMEIHDHLADREYILSILKKNNFTWHHNGELTIATNQSLLA